MLVFQGGGAGCERALALGHQAGSKVNVVDAFAQLVVFLVQQLSINGVLRQDVAAAHGVGVHAPAVAVVLVACFLVGDAPQAIAQVEGVVLHRAGRALAGQVALDVVGQVGDHGGALFDLGQAFRGVVGVGVVTRLAATGDVDAGQVVECVVAVVGRAENGRGRYGLGQTVRARPAGPRNGQRGAEEVQSGSGKSCKARPAGPFRPSPDPLRCR